MSDERFCIVGWYGTETIGDRSILDGIFYILGNVFENLYIELGSLYPLLSNRTLILDNDIYNNSFYKVKINIFDSRNKKELENKIKASDYCIMAGGPIMDLSELKIIEFAFKYAKKNNKKTIVLGCGLGPLKNHVNIKIAEEIFYYSDLIIFRDSMAISISKSLYGDRFLDKLCSIADPAILSIGRYLKTAENNTIRDSYIAINFRDFPRDYFTYSITMEEITSIIYYLSQKYEKVFLVPMHTFFIGSDDRYFLTKLYNMVKNDNIIVLHKPTSIYEIYSIFHSAESCIGMRYHSVIFQSLLNGNNYIVDYTDIIKGKIAGFLDDVDTDKFYKSRITNICSDDINFNNNRFDVLKTNKRFHYKSENYNEILSKYCNKIKI